MSLFSRTKMRFILVFLLVSAMSLPCISAQWQVDSGSIFEVDPHFHVNDGWTVGGVTYPTPTPVPNSTPDVGGGGGNQQPTKKSYDLILQVVNNGTQVKDSSIKLIDAFSLKEFTSTTNSEGIVTFTGLDYSTFDIYINDVKVYTLVFSQFDSYIQNNSLTLRIDIGEKFIDVPKYTLKLCVVNHNVPVQNAVVELVDIYSNKSYVDKTDLFGYVTFKDLPYSSFNFFVNSAKQEPITFDQYKDSIHNNVLSLVIDISSGEVTFSDISITFVILIIVAIVFVTLALFIFFKLIKKKSGKW